ncbi:MAG: TauD/TfdA family dioxygenase [Kiloniellales bacterium]|nr:TauD/TfdA family dioxygenase [Kiloniellales bacterium]
MAGLDIRLITKSLGAEVKSLDLSGTHPAETFMALKDAAEHYGVIALRQQNLEPENLLEITKGLGTPLIVPYVKPMDGYPQLIAVLKEADEKKIAVFGGDWHSDFSFLEQPPAFTLLYAVEVPEVGGDTLFTDMRRIYQTLPEEVREKLINTKACHSGHIYGVKNPPTTHMTTSRSIAISRNNPEADSERAHPAVRRHPASGEAALFVNPIYTTRLDGMSEEESEKTLDLIYAEARRDEDQLRWNWQVGDLLIWDNRIVMHCAVNDYDGSRRLLWRSTTQGEVPEAIA